MKTIAIIQSKGGAGKTTFALTLSTALAKRGNEVILSDLDPQAQLTEWIISKGTVDDWNNTILAALKGKKNINEVTFGSNVYPNKLYFIPAPNKRQLEKYGTTEMTALPNYRHLYRDVVSAFDDAANYLIIDCPNQISPIMELAIIAADMFVCPIDGFGGINAYADILELIMELRPHGDYLMCNVLNKLPTKTRSPKLRQDILDEIEMENVPLSNTEIRNCAYLFKLSRKGSSKDIYSSRPTSAGARDFMALSKEVERLFQAKTPPPYANPAQKVVNT